MDFSGQKCEPVHKQNTMIKNGQISHVLHSYYQMVPPELQSLWNSYVTVSGFTIGKSFYSCLGLFIAAWRTKKLFSILETDLPDHIIRYWQHLLWRQKICKLAYL